MSVSIYHACTTIRASWHVATQRSSPPPDRCETAASPPSPHLSMRPSTSTRPGYFCHTVRHGHVWQCARQCQADGATGRRCPDANVEEYSQPAQPPLSYCKPMPLVHEDMCLDFVACGWPLKARTRRTRNRGTRQKESWSRGPRACASLRQLHQTCPRLYQTWPSTRSAAPDFARLDQLALSLGQAPPDFSQTWPIFANLCQLRQLRMRARVAERPRGEGVR